jgi:hypothetical protein
MILEKWKVNFPVEFGIELNKMNDDSDPFSPIQSELFSSFETDFFSKISKNEELKQKNNEIKLEEEYNKPNVLNWEVKKVASQITLILSKKNNIKLYLIFPTILRNDFNYPFHTNKFYCLFFTFLI